MLNLAWSDLSEYDNAFRCLDIKRCQNENAVNHLSNKYEMIDSAFNSLRIDYSGLSIERDNLLGDISKFLLENFANKEGEVKIGQNTFKCKKKMRLF